MPHVSGSPDGMPIRATGIPWYFRQDYARILQIMDDAHVLPRTWDAWCKVAEGVERQIKARGAIVVRAEIDPDTFPAWCAARGLNVDADARDRYAAEVAYRKVLKTH